jgi:hypothetical protein
MVIMFDNQNARLNAFLRENSVTAEKLLESAKESEVYSPPIMAASVLSPIYTAPNFQATNGFTRIFRHCPRHSDATFPVSLSAESQVNSWLSLK